MTGDELMARYTWALDSGAFADLRGLFTEDVTFSMTIPGVDAPAPVSGVDAVIEFIEGIVGSNPDQLRHVITNVRVDGSSLGCYLVLHAVTPELALETKTTAVYSCDVEGDRLARIHIDFDRPF